MKKLIALLSMAILGACSATSETLFGDGKSANDANAKQNSELGSNAFMKSKIANLTSEKDQLKKLVESRKDSLQSMRNETNTAVSEYRNSVAKINAKLQVGTTPGNPELMDEWKNARAKLERVNNISFDIKRLVADVESDQSMVDYMLGSIQASYNISGTTEDEHKQLKALEEEVRQIGASISTFARKIDAEAERQQSYVEIEKNNLNDVAFNIKNSKPQGTGAAPTDYFANGGSVFSSDASYQAFLRETSEQEYGYTPHTSATPRQQRQSYVPHFDDAPVAPARSRSIPVERASVGPQLPPPASIVAPSTKLASRPLVVVQFDRPNVEFEEPLYQALSRALERNPSATFEVSGVAPQGKPNSNAKKNVKAVMTALTDMGLPASRVAMTMATDNVKFDEVRVYEK